MSQPIPSGGIAQSRETLPGPLGAFVRISARSGLDRAAWLREPSDELDGASPLDLLADRSNFKRRRTQAAQRVIEHIANVTADGGLAIITISRTTFENTGAFVGAITCRKR